MKTNMKGIIMGIMSIEDFEKKNAFVFLGKKWYNNRQI